MHSKKFRFSFRGCVTKYNKMGVNVGTPADVYKFRYNGWQFSNLNFRYYTNIGIKQYTHTFTCILNEFTSRRFNIVWYICYKKFAITGEPKKDNVRVFIQDILELPFFWFSLSQELTINYNYDSDFHDITNAKMSWMNWRYIAGIDT